MNELDCSYWIRPTKQPTMYSLKPSGSPFIMEHASPRRLPIGYSHSYSQLYSYPPLRFHVMVVSLFPSSFEGTAASFVFGESYSETEDLLGNLLEYSLLEFDQPTSRYSQNDLLRSYFASKALECLGKEKLIQLKERFVTYFIQILREAVTKPPPPTNNTNNNNNNNNNNIDTSTKKSPKQRQRRDSITYVTVMENLRLLFLYERPNLEACIVYSKDLNNEQLSSKLKQCMEEVITCLDGVEKERCETLIFTLLQTIGVDTASTTIDKTLIQTYQKPN